MNHGFSVFGTVAATFTLLWRDRGKVLRRIWIPAIFACGIIYLSFATYLRELLIFLDAPTDAHASIVLVITGIAVIALLFAYTLAAAAIAELAMDRPLPAELIQIGHRECRLYAAVLRFALVILSVFVAACMLCIFFRDLMPVLAVPAALLAALGLFALIVRVGFLLPAIAVTVPQGVVLRRSWAVSRKAFWRLAAIAAILLLPGLALELGGERLGRLVGIFPASSGITLQSHVELLHQVGSSFSILLSLSLLLTVLLQTAASVMVFRILSDTTK